MSRLLWLLLLPTTPLVAQGGMPETLPTMIAPARFDGRLPLRTATKLTLEVAPSLGIREDSLQRSPRGVFYDDLLIGDGAEVRPGDSVAVHFIGYLADGTPVTKSPKEPFRVRLGTGKVVDGWEDGLPGMRVGGRRMLIIPAVLGYGAKGSGPIPPNATLIFELMVVERK